MHKDPLEAAEDPDALDRKFEELLPTMTLEVDKAEADVRAKAGALIVRRVYKTQKYLKTHLHHLPGEQEEAKLAILQAESKRLHQTINTYEEELNVCICLALQCTLSISF
jgi:hypothetical protein